MTVPREGGVGQRVSGLKSDRSDTARWVALIPASHILTEGHGLAVTINDPPGVRRKLRKGTSKS
ncbi:hypothetical protein SAMN05444398_11956 [Roseovarius pacificus]|uniref:Uncharacterized protein n=1 Tax=Roseovarius pacificus TaxID=337701 RepID=A0A1M7JEA0_9RHOB|nr:hypothetical protein SAMN05444398_11956 [Roseovarius pacificus]